MNLIETIRVGVDSLLSNPLRSFLTVLGMVIGIASVIVLISIGESFRRSIVGAVQGAGADVLAVRAGSISFERTDIPQRLTRADGAALLNNPAAPAVIDVAAKMGANAQADYQGKPLFNLSVVGVTANLREVERIEVVMGRFVSERDEAQRARVVVVPPTMAQELFPGEDPLGKRLTISGYDFEIVGVTRSGGIGELFAQTAYVPLSVVQQRLSAARITRGLDVDELAVRVRSG
jgi:putative ABC transport system permease protein